MKKAIFITAMMAITISAFSQAKTDVIKAPADTTYRPDQKRVYTIQLTAGQLIDLTQTSQAGVIPYLKSVKLTMDKLEGVQGYFNTIHQGIAIQFRQQYVADSLAYRKKALYPAKKQK
ncbi:hypothetical protein [Mucilaginibacter sp.]|uniref:hypothetical protein n=1 Tax=Mucilaginibacter sp. TaxID=1882438 RepID=UPI0032663AD2